MRDRAGETSVYRAVAPGCRYMTESHMDDSRMNEETSGYYVPRVYAHTEGIWSCQLVRAIGSVAAVVNWCTTEPHREIS